MLDYFIVFLLGAITMKFFQFMLSITPNYYIFKHAEYTVFRILAELHVQKMTIVKLMELCYRDIDKDAEFTAVETAVNKRYNDIINTYITKVKTLLPYKTNYTNLNEAIVTLLEDKKNG